MKHLKLYETQVSPFIYIITEWSKSNNKLYLIRAVKTTKFELTYNLFYTFNNGDLIKKKVDDTKVGYSNFDILYVTYNEEKVLIN